MTRIITALAVALAVSGQAQAQNSEKCKKIGAIAESIMKARQRGIPISKLMEVSEENAGGSLRPVILFAYERPRYNSEEYQQEEIEDFRNRIELQCYKVTE